jgi:protein TonB
MLNTLIASQAPRTRSGSAQFLSLLVHGTLIGGAVLATQRAVDGFVPDVRPDIVFRVPVDPAPAPPAPPTTASVLPPGFRLVPTPVHIPNVLPPIDLTQRITDPNDFFNARGVPGGDPNAVVPVGPNVAMTVEQVDRAAALLPGSGRPVYPEALRSAGAAGEVLVQVVIDTVGRAEMATLEIVSSTHDRFSESVTRALSKARFAPAEFGGRKVRQVVRMPFVFSLEKR